MTRGGRYAVVALGGKHTYKPARPSSDARSYDILAIAFRCQRPRHTHKHSTAAASGDVTPRPCPTGGGVATGHTPTPSHSRTTFRAGGGGGGGGGGWVWGGEGGLPRRGGGGLGLGGGKGGCQEGGGGAVLRGFHRCNTLECVGFMKQADLQFRMRKQRSGSDHPCSSSSRSSLFTLASLVQWTQKSSTRSFDQIYESLTIRFCGGEQRKALWGVEGVGSFKFWAESGGRGGG